MTKKASHTVRSDPTQRFCGLRVNPTKSRVIAQDPNCCVTLRGTPLDRLQGAILANEPTKMTPGPG